MSNIITIGFITEGTSDVRFLQNIIHRTFQEVSFDCFGEIEVFEPEVLYVNPDNFTGEVFEAAKTAEDKGLLVLCVHADADFDSDTRVLANKITPAFNGVLDSVERICKNLVAIIPVQMTEAWMLASKDLFKEEIGTNKSDHELGIDRFPESYADPKAAINNAIRTAFADMRRRQRSRQLAIRDLYQPMGQKTDIEDLERLPSFRKFKLAVIEAFRKLQYIK
ncbi:MAG: hypothetical protein AB2L24_10645 [Mangrovibacterium sp.]